MAISLSLSENLKGIRDMRLNQFTVIVLLLLVCIASPVGAGVILSATSTTASSTSVGSTASNISDQSGLSAGFVSGVTDFSGYLAGNPMHGNCCASPFTGWAATAGLPITVDFDLGSSYFLTETAIWNWNGAVSAGVNRFEIFSATDGTFSSLTSLGVFNLNPGAINQDPIGHQVIDFTDTTTQFLRFNLISNHGFSGGNSGIGLDEVAFHAGTAVPEPSILVLIGSGLLGLGFVRRRRQA